MDRQGQEQIKLPFERQDIRILNDNGEAWFVLADVCRVLEIGNTSMAAGRLEPDEKAELSITDVSSKGVEQSRVYMLVNESGLYSLVLRSRKPQAKRFRKWVTAEVLPSIRRTGRYHTNQQAEATLDQRLRMLEQEQQAIRERLAETQRLAAV